MRASADDTDHDEDPTPVEFATSRMVVLDTPVSNSAVENGFVTLQPRQGLVLVKQS